MRAVGSRQERRPGSTAAPRLPIILAMLAGAIFSGSSFAAESEDLASLSLEELGDLEVTSVSKSPQLLRLAPAAIHVISEEDIQRSGVTSLAEALRLAPNLSITQYGSSSQVLSTRGFSGNPDAQNFSNKLLLLIDGRSVYSPLFSGIYLDSQDLLFSDVSRIEVISGPGATLWGANAMNGVINVITRPADLTTGGTLSIAAGNLERVAGARFGTTLGENSALRVYAKALEREPMSLARGTRAQDGWHRAQGGFRLDLHRGVGTVTLQGDVYDGSNERPGAEDEEVSGANLLARWQGRTRRSSFHVQSWFDHVQRGEPVDGSSFRINTLDLEVQQSLQLGNSHWLVWGMGSRFSHYDISNTDSLLFLPPERTLRLWNFFAQDTVSLGPALKLTVGLKMEHHSLSTWQPQPDVRLAWQASDSLMLWAAASRAVRTSTPFDEDVLERLGGVDFLAGNPDFRSEKVMSYETGTRARVNTALTLSASGFYNRYRHLRTIEVSGNPGEPPLLWGNGMAGHSYGINAWADWRITQRWSLRPGLAWLRKKLHFTEGASGLLGTGQAGNDPRLNAQLKSALDLDGNQTLDLLLRHVSKLPDPALPAYTELSARYAWRFSDQWEVSVRGTNLLHARHREYPAPAGNLIRRGVLAEVRWRQ